jgi:hypothetical protein
MPTEGLLAGEVSILLEFWLRDLSLCCATPNPVATDIDLDSLYSPATLSSLA